MSFSWPLVLLAILGMPWLITASLQSLPLSSRGILLFCLSVCLSVSLPFL